ncbi:Kinesin-like protein kif24 [Kappamyces sp. JEL0829]|nr:Kinesin-like protein kif24 [Kappamyces sp. JEL0829]
MLDAYYGSLTAYGVRSVESLMQLTMQDYGVVGVHSMEDRKRRPSSLILGLFQLIQTLKSDFPSAALGDAALKAPVAIPIKRPSVSSTKPSTSFSVGSSALAKSSGSLDAGMASSNDDTGRGRFEKPSRYSGVDTDDDHEESPPHHRKLARSVPSMASSPKQSRSNLNAYGVPNSFPNAIPNTAKKQSGGDLTDRIRVCVRKRPLSKKELKRGESDVARVHGRRSITILEPKVKVDLTKYVENHEFVFDEAFDADATNDEVYKRTAAPLVDYIFEGGKATCFA